MKKKIASFFVNMDLILMAIIVLVPVSWIVLSSFNVGSGLSGSSLIPKSFTLENYKNLLNHTNYLVWFRNTLTVALLNAFISVILIMLTAWVMSRFRFKGKKTTLLSILILSMFPCFLSMTAIYTLFATLGILDQPIALVIIYSAGSIPYNVWLVKGYLDGISSSLDEAAYIDGSSKLNTLVKIIIPMSLPIITYCAVSQFMFPWMDYILPNMLLSSDKNKTIAIGLYAMITGQENTNFTTFAAGAVLIAIPITILFLFFQKYLVQGISSGASKE